MVTTAASTVTPSYHPPSVGARTICYMPAAAVTPQTLPPTSTLPAVPPLQPPACPLSCSLFGGSQSGHGGSNQSGYGTGTPFGPRCTHEYLSGYYWEPGMFVTSPVSVPWLECSLQGPYNW
jgi:hypothetical protein